MPTDPWDPRAAAAGTPIGFPWLGAPYPQSGGGIAAYTDPVTRPAPTLSTLTPNTLAAGVGGATVTLTGTNFTNATRVSFGGVLDSPRMTQVTYIGPTSLKAQLNRDGIAAAAYPVTVFNQDNQPSTPAVNFTVT